MRGDPKIPAAQYLRKSSDEPLWSFSYQADAIARYADAHGFTIVNSYEDPGVSGITIKRRDGLARLLHDVVSGKAQFKAIFVYDISRWGRFQDSDESAHYEFICKCAGIPVHYCAETFANDGSMSSSIMKALKRAMAGEYSRELSERIVNAKRAVGLHGFRAGGFAGYGLRRALVSSDLKPIRLLAKGEYVQRGRVTLVPGPAREIAIVHEIYERAISGKQGALAIARELNKRQIKPPGYTACCWNYGHILEILTNPKYVGQAVLGRTFSRLSTSVRTQPRENWLVKDSAFVPIVDRGTFDAAQKALRDRTFYKTNEELLDALRKFLSREGMLSQHMIDNARDLPSVRTYVARFGSITNVYKLIGYDYSWHIFTHPRMRKIMSQSRRRRERLREEFLGCMRSLFSGKINISRHGPLDRPLLIFPDGMRISVLICPSTKTPLGYQRWRIPCLRADQSQVTLLCLCNETNDAFSEFHAVPSTTRPRRVSVVKRGDWQLIVGTKVDDLSRLPNTSRLILDRYQAQRTQKIPAKNTSAYPAA